AARRPRQPHRPAPAGLHRAARDVVRADRPALTGRGASREGGPGPGMPLIPNKREFLARRLRDAGALRLLERAARPPGLLGLTHHRIGAAAGPLYAPVVSAPPEALRAQLRRLRDTFRVLTLDEAVALAGSGFRVDEPAALVTFDDGTRDHAEVALPVLREL